MQDDEFKEWMQAQGYDAGTITTQLARLRRIEAHYGSLAGNAVDGSIAQLEAQFAYSTQDERDGKPNPVKLPIEGNLRTNLASYKSTIAYYRRFIEGGENAASRKAPETEISREAVLATMEDCDRLGLDEFLKTYGFGKPRDYWVMRPDNSKRYPAKATVGVAHGNMPGGSALSAAEFYGGFGEQAANTTLRKLGFVVVNWPELQRARESFVRQMPGFTSFRETSGAYWDIERRYKNQLIEEARAIAASDGDDRTVGESTYRILVGGQQGVPLNWRTLPEVRSAESDLTDRFYVALGQLARSQAPLEEAIAHAAHELEAIREAGIPGLRRGEVLSIPITVWATLHPEEASWFKIAKIEEMGKRFFGRKLFPQNDFREADLTEWLQLMRALFGLLDNEFGWEPQDLFDVQGFVWVALGGNERSAAATNDVPIWLVTSLWGDEDGTDRFIARGDWSLLTDTDSSNNRRVREMQVGDRIFLKDFIPRAADLPFDAGGGVVTANRIRAVGTISEKSTDGLRVGVDWEAMEPRTWYFYTNNQAVWRLKDPSENHPSADQLRAFLIDGVDQDYAWFLNHPFWHDRLFGSPSNDSETTMQSTNLILYGPPGTGKTYRTAAEAVRLCDGDTDFADDEAGRAALMARYGELVAARQIEFVTFHQNFSYEDFVEGLRPHTGDAEEGATGFTLKPEAGIFRTIAERAARPVKTGSGGISLDDRRVFKMSLGQSNDPHSAWVYEESIQDGFALFGFEDVDWSADRFASKEAIVSELQTRLPDENVTAQRGMVKSPDRFRNQLSVGDIVVASKGLNAFRAIGVVEGGYEYAPKPHGRYSHRRKVRWLWEEPEGVPVAELMSDRRFSLDTVYELPKSSLNLAVLSRLINSGEDAQATGGETLPHVLVIDEINRANISKVFGELITLIEPDKRLGQPNALKVRLPYSKREFGVPSNLHIIGTMNTADRSIALLDTALRRRFRFEEIAPDTSVPAFRQAEADSGLPLAKVLDTMNQRIEYLVDRDHRIGHAFFIGCDTKAKADAAMRDKVIPLLQEYFFDDWNRLAAVLGEKDKGGNFLDFSEIKDPMGEGQPIKSWRVKRTFDEGAYHRLVSGKAPLTSVVSAIDDEAIGEPE